METIVSDIIPRQQTGKETNIEYKFNIGSREEALEIFKIATGRLLNINHWERLCGVATADFKLTDQNGKEVQRLAAEGDHFKIDIPGPGTITGRGYDWVRIEKIQENTNPDNDIESIVMRVRPAANPKKPGRKIAHFFNEQATSSFVVERQGTLVRTGVYGRNEKPNTFMGNFFDKIRNFIIAVSALAGISSVQWRDLCKGLIHGEKSENLLKDL